MKNNNKLQPLRGFRDFYPKDKQVQNYLFDKIRQTALLFGFEEYDGPALEPVDLYLAKTSKELVSEQSFVLTDKKGIKMMLRPEMTPSLARMIAAKRNELILPIKLYNIGLRYRYEAPQKGRAREFYQADFDIIGSADITADIDILYLAVTFLQSFNLKPSDVTIFVNSRQILQNKLIKSNFTIEQLPKIFNIIDKKNKLPGDQIKELFIKQGFNDNQINQINEIIQTDFANEPYFLDLFEGLKTLKIDQYIKINPKIVRGLDYYTGLVFEAQAKGTLTRAILGGGRYDNLISNYDDQAKLTGVGFAFSDVILLSLLTEKNLLPNLSQINNKILITIFSPETFNYSLNVQKQLIDNKIPCQLYSYKNAKLEKQLKYADRKNFQYVLIAGPNEIKQNQIKLKNLKTSEQKDYKQEDLIKFLISSI